MNRLIRSLGPIGAATVLSGSAVFAFAAPASGSLLPANPLLRILPTAPTLSISPSTVHVPATSDTVEGTPEVPVVITATVGPLDLLVTPSGTGTFTVVYDGVPTGPGVVQPLSGSCLILLSQCTAAVTFYVSGADTLTDAPATPAGPYFFNAQYSGDFLSRPSGATGELTVLPHVS